jgi:hypothetical protein
MFPQPVQFRTQETVAVLRHITDVAEVLGRRSSSQGILPPVSTTPRHADFKGVTLDDLVVLEQVFSWNVYVYLCQTLHKIIAITVHLNKHAK